MKGAQQYTINMVKNMSLATAVVKPKVHHTVRLYSLNNNHTATLSFNNYGVKT